MQKTAKSSPATATTSSNAFRTEVARRYTHARPTMSTPVMTLAATGVENRRDTFAGNSGSAR